MSTTAEETPMFERTILDPKATKALVPECPIDVWVYRYTHPSHAWTFSVATHGAPGSGSFSLGGFRIVPEDRAAIAGFSPDREAIGLAVGMEGKVFWSRLIRAAGPEGSRYLSKIVGGKCVLLPTKGARVGEALDKELLSFGVTCLSDFEETSGVYATTGEDLGHGMLHDGSASSLEFLHEHFYGSVLSDTSIPTAEGNFNCLVGGLHALKRELRGARIGLIGCGHIGTHLLKRLQDAGAEVSVLEASISREAELRAEGVKVWHVSQKSEFMRLPNVALAVNASGASLDSATVGEVCKNPETLLVTGCENLVMPQPADAERLRAAGKVFTPTEYCGMMGYLTAVEEYFCRRSDKSFTMDSMYELARKLEEPTAKTVERCLQNKFARSFADELKLLYSH